MKMNANNKAAFLALSPQYYFKSAADMLKVAKGIEEGLMKELGFDERSGGFLVVHCGHAYSALGKETPVCILLKRLGYGVILLEESGVSRVCDVQIGQKVLKLSRLQKRKISKMPFRINSARHAVNQPIYCCTLHKKSKASSCVQHFSIMSKDTLILKQSGWFGPIGCSALRETRF